MFTHTHLCDIPSSPPSLIPLVRDFQGPGSKSTFSPFPPGGFNIRIQPYSLKLMSLIQSQQSTSKHPFLTISIFFGCEERDLRKTMYCICFNVCVNVLMCVHMGPLFNLRAVKCHTRALMQKTNQTCSTRLRAHTNHTYFTPEMH